MSELRSGLTGTLGLRHFDRVWRGLLLLCLGLAITACDKRGGKIPYDPAGFGAPDRASAVTGAYDLPLGPLDTLQITVFRVPDLSGEYQVDGKGFIDMPLIGAVNVRDKDSEQLAATLEQMYGQRYLNSPDVTVRLETTNQRNVTIEGGVNTPGIYPLPGQTTLLGAIALAKGIKSEEGNPRRVVIFRKKDGQTVAASFDVIAIRRGEMADPLVYPGDTIVVDSSKLRAIYRDLLQTLPIFTVFSGI